MRIAAHTGIPWPAMRAYGRAQLRSDPSCRLSWVTLAGIGFVESQHGTMAGRVLAADGRPSSPILGPALDGTGGFAAMPANAESALWHGDGQWDHAVGPMQFLPATWRRWAADGDRDGVADPNDVDDAALAAAHYLCADRQDLATASGWAAAVFSYNHSQAYVDDVFQAATTYAARS